MENTESELKLKQRFYDFVKVKKKLNSIKIKIEFRLNLSQNLKNDFTAKIILLLRSTGMRFQLL